MNISNGKHHIFDLDVFLNSLKKNFASKRAINLILKFRDKTQRFILKPPIDFA